MTPKVDFKGKTQTDVLVSHHQHAGELPSDSELDWYLENRIELGKSIYVTNDPGIGADTIMDACEPKSNPFPQRGRYYTIVRENAPGGWLAWDSDLAIHRAVAFSRMVHPNAISFEYRATVSGFGSPDPIIHPIQPDYAFCSRIHRRWLKPPEWRKVAQMLSRWSTSEAKKLPRVNDAIWFYQQMYSEQPSEVRIIMLGTIIEALTGADWDERPRVKRQERFPAATLSLSRLVDMPFSSDEAGWLWELRSKAVHTGRFVPPPTIQAEKMDTGAFGTSDEMKLLIRAEEMIGRALREIIENDIVAIRFRCRESVKHWIENQS